MLIVTAKEGYCWCILEQMSNSNDALPYPPPEQILHEAQNLALLAVSADQQKDIQAAIYYYNVMPFYFSSICNDCNVFITGINRLFETIPFCSRKC